MTRWYLTESFDVDAQPIEVRKSDYRSTETMEPPPVGCRVEYTTDGNNIERAEVVGVVWDVPRGLARVVVRKLG